MSLNYHIVLADDDPDDRLILREAIRDFSANITISEVSDGRELIEFMKAQRAAADMPDVIILDINMPFVDGVEALKVLRESGLVGNIPVYIVSTMRNRKRVAEAGQFGIAATHAKPNTMKGFQQLVQTIIHGSLQ